MVLAFLTVQSSAKGCHVYIHLQMQSVIRDVYQSDYKKLTVTMYGDPQPRPPAEGILHTIQMLQKFLSMP